MQSSAERRQIHTFEGEVMRARKIVAGAEFRIVSVAAGLGRLEHLLAARDHGLGALELGLHAATAGEAR